MNKIIVTTTPIIEGEKIKEYLGIVVSNEVLGVNFISDSIASFSDIFGGRSGSYRGKLDNLKEAVLGDIKKKAIAMGANAVVGVSIEFNEITGKGKQMFMASAKGTAVKLEKQSKVTDVELDQDSTIVDDETIEFELKREHAIGEFEKYRNPSDEDKSIVSTVVDSKTAERLLDILKNKCIIQPTADVNGTPTYELRSDVRNFICEYLKGISSEEATRMVYERLFEEKCAQDFFDVIRQVRLLCPEKIAEMLKGTPEQRHMGIMLLTTGKKEYTAQDINSLHEIDKALEFKTLGRHEQKKGMLGTKYIYLCPNGHESNGEEKAEDCYCPKCMQGIYGFTKEEVNAIEIFRTKLAMIDMHK